VRKILLIALFISLFSLRATFFDNKVYAVCQIELAPQVIPKDFTAPIAITAEEECLSKRTDYQVASYSITEKSLKDAYDLCGSTFPSGVAESEKIQSVDGKTLTAFTKNERVWSKASCTSDLGLWKFLVCLPKDIDNRTCDQNPVAEGTVFISQPTGPSPTPTPTPEPDQPIIHYDKQTQCLFRYTEDPNFSIPIVAENIDNQAIYHSWWKDENKEIVKEIIPDPNQQGILNTILWGDVIKKLKNPTKDEGHLYCVDMKGEKRAGDNCIRLRFTRNSPEKEGIDTSCSPENMGSITLTPIPPTPPCAQWADKDGNPIKDDDLKIYMDDKGNLKTKTFNLTCIKVQTAFGGISTDPFKFVKDIMGTLLGLAGGIAVILIIIAGYRLMASQGNPEAVQAAREQIISAIVGLVFVIFSLVILQVIGVDILKIPGFGR